MFNFLNRLWNKEEFQSPPADLRLGRFSDIYKSPQQYQAWEKSLDDFGKKNYLDSYESFLIYLSDVNEENLTYQRFKDHLTFSFYQGSKRIVGTANLHQLRAHTEIAVVPHEDVSLLRQLMEQNYDLQYARYSLTPDQEIVLIFDTYTLDGSPYKLFYALKELATNADKYDDLLLEDFPELIPIAPFRIEIEEAEKDMNVQFLRHSIEATFREIETGSLEQEKYPGAMVYLLLSLAYKLDFLLKPEGFIQDVLEGVHRLYFGKETQSMADKQRLIQLEFKRILERKDEHIKSEFYRVKSTFGITTPIDHERFVALLDAELGQMLWYRDNGHHEVAFAIMQYLVGHVLFNFAPAAPTRSLLQFFFNIFENDFFAERNLPGRFYNAEEDTFYPSSIKAHFAKLQDHFVAEFPSLNLDASRLNYSSKIAFAESYLLLIRELNV